MARRYMEPEDRDEVDPEGFHEALPAAAARPYAYRDETVATALTPADRVASVVMAAAWIVEIILGLRIVLQLVAASSASAFAGFIYNISYPLTWPFTGIAGSSAVGTGGILEWAAVIAMIVYGIVAYVIVRALHSARDTV